MNARPQIASQSSGALALAGSAAGHAAKNIQSLTGLRFYAAFSVFFSHMYHFGYFGVEGPARLLFAGIGHLGVSLFYVLSGFVLLIRYHDSFAEGAGLKRFYVARLARIYPAFIATGLLAIPIEFFSPYRGQMLWTLGANATLTHCLSPQTCGRLNDVGWSVGVEAAFYVLFPLLLAWLRPGWKLGASMVLVTGGVVALQMLGHGGFWASDRFFINRVPEFFCGMLAGAFFLRGKSLPGANRVIGLRVWITVLAGILALAPLWLEAFHLTPYYYLCLMLPSSLLISVLACGERQGVSLRLFTAAAIVFGGDISYSFYLLHNLLLRYLRHGSAVVFHASLADTPLWMQLGLASLALVSALIGSALLYRYVEKPGRQKLRA
ncbi:MAG: acyltransferase [Vampirovibrionales bacterium]|nr:acyltransferase [Vampirovibrionales bacterium]